MRRVDIPLAKVDSPFVFRFSIASHGDMSVFDFFNSVTTTSAGLLTIVAAMPPRVPPTEKKYRRR